MAVATSTVDLNVNHQGLSLTVLLIDNDETLARSETHTQLKTRVLKPYLDENGQNRYIIYDQNGSKNRTLEATYTNIAHIGGGEGTLGIFDNANRFTALHLFTYV